MTECVCRLYTPLVWFTACLLSLVVLTILRRRDSLVCVEHRKSQGRVLAKLFSIYLVIHIISNIFNLLAYAVPKYSLGFEIAGNLVVAVAAPVYIVLSTAMIFCGQFYALKNAMLVSVLSYIPYFFAYISVPNNTRILLLFFYYFSAALYAYIGAWVIFCRHGLKHKNCEYQAFAFLFAASFGMFNFLLPAFAFLQNNDAYSNNNIEAMSFLGRVLDAIFYLPIATTSFIWLDKNEIYHINVGAEGTKYKENESSEKLNGNDSPILLGVTDSPTDDDDIGINDSNQRNKEQICVKS